MAPETISVKPGYDAAKANLQTAVDAFTPPEGQRPSDLTAAMEGATSSGTPSLSRVIELLNAVAKSAAEDHAAGVEKLTSRMSTVNSWKTTVTGIDSAGGEGVAGVPPVTPPAGPPAQVASPESVIPGDKSPKRLGK
ncbi:MAG: hypothetical protein KDB70_04135 [Mycobacterium sp.]|nr:hypothetical protein [Mycobacterium sp.]